MSMHTTLYEYAIDIQLYGYTAYTTVYEYDCILMYAVKTYKNNRDSCS